MISSGIHKMQKSSVKSPVHLHNRSFQEERAIVEFVGPAKMDPQYRIADSTQWPAFRASQILEGLCSAHSSKYMLKRAF